MTEDGERSEFGAGVVTCLVKFSGHLENERATLVKHLAAWDGMGEDERKRARRESKRFPNGDYGRLYHNVTLWQKIGQDLDETPISHAIKMWANGASDHFYDLDHEHAPAPLRELAALTLRMGHAMLDKHEWGWSDWERMLELWEQATIAVDQALGIQADWGRWP